MKKIFSQKIILTMLVGLFLGGCSLDIRKPFYIGDIVKKKFIDNFEDGDKYGLIYTYNASDNSLTGHCDFTKYFYDPESGNGTTTGTFSKANGYTTLTAEIISGVPVITSIPFLDYFKNGETYDGYKYAYSSRALNGIYSYNGDGTDSLTGTFGNLYDSKVLIATVDDSAVVSVREMKYIEYFKDNYIYNDGYTFHYVEEDPNKSYFEKDGIKFIYDDETGAVASGTGGTGGNKTGTGTGTFGGGDLTVKFSSDLTTQVFVTVSVSVGEFIFNYVRSIKPNREGDNITDYLDNAMENYDSTIDTLVTMSGGAIAGIYGADASSIDPNSSCVKINTAIGGNLYIDGDISSGGVFIGTDVIVNGNIIVNGCMKGGTIGSIYLKSEAEVNGSIIVNGSASNMYKQVISLECDASVGGYVLVNGDVISSMSTGIELLSGSSVGKNIIVNGGVASSGYSIRNSRGTLNDIYLAGEIIGSTSGLDGVTEARENVKDMPVSD